MTAILGYIRDMIPYLGIALPLILIFRIIYNKIRRSNRGSLLHEIGVIGFLLFMVALFSQTIFAFLYTGPVVTRSFSNINLVPLRVFQDNYYAITELQTWEPILINFLGNIIIFMPIGFALPSLWKSFNRLWNVAATGFGISLFIETTQLTQNRSSDVDDLWLNTLGCTIGYLCYHLIKREFPYLMNKFSK
ncbi:VanZ family protein [Sporosarcina sp. 179-K 3D1 HS]|uniref:VanZ family protein n=1 Tax=Sporosarcina sp. 179-K 3D1 HS TaxID=3232169 RepID=UPI0039A1650A